MRNAQSTKDQLEAYINGLTNSIIPLEHLREIRLAKQIMKFSDILLLTVDGLQLNKMCDYVYELATVFHDFYKDCYVVSKIASNEGNF